MQIFALIDSIWNFHDIPASRARFEEALRSDGLSLDERLQLSSQLGRTYSIERDFQRAHEILDGVEKSLVTDTPVARLRYLLERGRTFNSAREKSQAIPLFLEALELAKSLQLDFLSVDAAHMLAIAESNPELQMKWNMQALQMAEDSSDQRARNWLGSLYNNIAWTLHDQKKYSEALVLFQKALQFRILKEKAAEIRIAKWCVARCLRSLERWTEALQLQFDLEQEFTLAGETDGYVFEEICELSLLLNEKEKVREYAQKAHDFFAKDKWLQANDSERLSRLQRLAKGE